jgi:CDP-diacylglycerol---serine O-phosphatidyltransferase
MRRVLSMIPNAITSMNLIAGSMAVIFAIDGHLIWAGIFICFAAVFDFLDGLAARLLHAYSELGKELDSLADMVSFGLAPAAILFTLLEFSLFGQNQPIYAISAQWHQWLVLFLPLLMPVFSALRLARYNVVQSGEAYFKGLPTPSNGIFWASMGLMLEMPEYQSLFQQIYSTKILLLLGAFTSGMLIISLPMFSLKFKNFRFDENWYRYLFLFISLLLLIFLHVYGIALIIFSYIVLNIIFYLAGIKY